MASRDNHTAEMETVDSQSDAVIYTFLQALPVPVKASKRFPG